MNPMRLLMLLFLSAAYICAQGKTKECLVGLRVVDYYGRPQAYKIVWFRDESGKDHANRFNGLFGRLPCDYETYAFQVSRTDLDHPLGKLEGKLTVQRKDIWKTIVTNPNVRLYGKGAGELSMTLPSDHVWRGRITGKGKKPVWVHIRSAFGSGHKEASVDENGEFQVYSGFAEGRYLLYVVDVEGEIIYSTVLEVKVFAPQVPFSIDLESYSPSVRIVR